MNIFSKNQIIQGEKAAEVSVDNLNILSKENPENLKKQNEFLKLLSENNIDESTGEEVVNDKTNLKNAANLKEAEINKLKTSEGIVSNKELTETQQKSLTPDQLKLNEKKISKENLSQTQEKLLVSNEKVMNSEGSEEIVKNTKQVPVKESNEINSILNKTSKKAELAESKLETQNKQQKVKSIFPEKVATREPLEESKLKDIFSKKQTPIENKSSERPNIFTKSNNVKTEQVFEAKNIDKSELATAKNQEKSFFVNSKAAKNTATQETAKTIANDIPFNVNKNLNQKRVPASVSSQAYEKMATKKSFLDSRAMNTNKVKAQPTAVTNLQDIIFPSNIESEQVINNSTQGMTMHDLKVVGQANDVKNVAESVFNLNNIKENDSANQVITKIQDYIIQNKFENKSQVEMSFKHHDLGKVDLLLEKMENNNINVKIATHSTEGNKFFQMRQLDLMNTLTKSGINLGEFKLEMGPQLSSSSSSSQNQSSDGEKSSSFFSKNEHQSQNGKRDQESQKRQSLWQQYADKEVA